jgi:hypothetical protein
MSFQDWRLHSRALNLTARFEFGFKKMWSLELCWPLKDFEFTNENQYFDPVLDFNNETTAEDLYQFGHPSDEVSEPAGDHCDYDFGYDGGDNCDAADYSEQSQQVSHEYAVASIGEAGQENIFSYFDTAPLKNWAGPEHWRSRPLRGNTFAGFNDNVLICFL